MNIEIGSSYKLALDTFESYIQKGILIKDTVNPPVQFPIKD